MHTAQHPTHDDRATSSSVAGAIHRILDRPGLALKRLTLAVGAIYFTLIAITNLVNLLHGVHLLHGTILDSGNIAYIRSITKSWSLPTWFDDIAVAGAFCAESFGAVLFWRAVVQSRNGTARCRAVWLALAWNIVVWLGFIVGTEVFVAYGSESPFRELLMIGLLMVVIVAVVPDDAGAAPGQATSASGR